MTLHTFYKQYLYKQSQAEIGKENAILRLDFFYLKIIHVLHPPYRPKIIGHILKN